MHYLLVSPRVLPPSFWYRLLRLDAESCVFYLPSPFIFSTCITYLSSQFFLLFFFRYCVYHHSDGHCMREGFFPALVRQVRLLCYLFLSWLSPVSAFCTRPSYKYLSNHSAIQNSTWTVNFVPRSTPRSVVLRRDYFSDCFAVVLGQSWFAQYTVYYETPEGQDNFSHHISLGQCRKTCDLGKPFGNHHHFVILANHMVLANKKKVIDRSGT